MKFATGLKLGVSMTLLFATHAIGLGTDTASGRRVIEPFDFRGVTLEDGFLKAQVEDARRYYLALPEDDFLKPYRERAGFPAPGTTPGGWYRENRFNVFGQIVSGLARLYAATGDEACRDKANRLVAEWAKCIVPDGYFFAAPPPHAPHYIYDKFVWGLLDTYLYCGNIESLKHMARITEWAEKNLDRTRPFSPDPAEWYTLSENLFRAYEATGDKRYRDFAEVWEYPQYWDVYAENGDIFQARNGEPPRAQYHAYSHVNCLGGAAAAYRVKGNPKYLAAITNGYDFLESAQFYATGGYGPDEQLLAIDEFAERIYGTHKSFETQCGSWACFKLTRELMSLTGEAKYGDWAERMSINGIGASIPMTKDGRVTYYMDYNVHGGEKHQHLQPWSCCTGTRPQAVAELANLVWFHDRDNLYLNLFTPSAVQWNSDGETVTITQVASFPQSSTVTLSVDVASPCEFGLKVRVPGWLVEPMNANVNGRPAALGVDSRHWASIKRTWKDGDRVELNLPMGAWTRPFSKVSTAPFALLYGPTVLVSQTSEPVALGRLSPDGLVRDLRPAGGSPLEFRLASSRDARVRPYFAVGEGERYYMHIAPDLGSRIHHGDLTYTGKWIDNGPHHVTVDTGSIVEYAFEGRGFRWIGNRYDDAGRAEVSIDGQVVTVLDQYGPRRGVPFIWTWDQLKPGAHRVRIKLLPESNPSSKSRYLNISGIDVIK